MSPGWTDIYHLARQRGDAATGFYHDNIRVDLAGGPVIVRIPRPGAAAMDLRVWREETVLAAIAPYVRHAPRLRFHCADPVFAIHDFIPGISLHDLAPPGVAVPTHVALDVATLFRELTDVPAAALPPLAADWPADGDCAGFARRVAGFVRTVYDTYLGPYGELFRRFGIPADPLAGGLTGRSAMTRRRFGCLHADVHRQNIIVAGSHSVFLDWELAMWGDPVYDLAVHLHRSAYRPAEREEQIRQWLTVMPERYTSGWERDLETYLGLEEIKSSIVDTVRCAQAYVDRPDPEGTHDVAGREIIETLKAKLNAARRRWDYPDPIAFDEVHTGLDAWCDRKRRERARA
jgi:aminoglycoside phosphotransferase (APT) family kinase protein